jgi:DNA polymerase-3 subunit epsilon
MMKQDGAAEWARAILQSDALIIDTETTGLDDEAEIVQIGVVDMCGNVLLDALVCPLHTIPAEATAIHGIRDEDVVRALTFAELYPTLRDLIGAQSLVIYGADFDLRMLDQATLQHSCPRFVFNRIHCLMEHYAAFWGDWSDYHGNYRWQKLTAACRQQGIAVEGQHSAAGDCKLSLALLKKMAEWKPEDSPQG